MVATGIASAMISSISWADRPNFKTNDGVWTHVSGVKHVHKLHYAPEKSKCGLSGFTLYETADIPYKLYMRRHRLCYRNCTPCEGADIAVRKGAIGLTVPNPKLTVDVKPDHIITAVQVCLNGKKDASKKRIKGLRVWSARFASNGSLKRNSTPVEKTLPNCKSWQAKVSCPAGQVAIGARGYYVDQKRGFAGMSLKCATPNSE